MIGFPKLENNPLSSIVFRINRHLLLVDSGHKSWMNKHNSAPFKMADDETNPVQIQMRITAKKGRHEQLTSEESESMGIAMQVGMMVGPMLELVSLKVLDATSQFYEKPITISPSFSVTTESSKGKDALIFKEKKKVSKTKKKDTKKRKMPH